MPPFRVAAFVDGFNVYHAIRDLRDPKLRWLNLWSLCKDLLKPNQELLRVHYFSAYASWDAGKTNRHRAYVAALTFAGVTPVLGNFKKKERYCKSCKKETGPYWEEKETDVNVAIHLLNEARKDAFDAALLLTNDSDIVPAVRMLRTEFPMKRVFIVTPPGRTTSRDLLNAAQLEYGKVLTAHRLRQHLFPLVVAGPSGGSIACPVEWR